MQRQRATQLKLIPQATIHTEVVESDDAFFTDFTGLRGLFKEQVLFRALRIDPADFSFDSELYRNSQVLVFLAGMRGVGKSVELRRYVREIEQPSGYLVVYCSIDNELDSDYLEYAEILIFQLEKLIDRLWEKNIRLDDELVGPMLRWFQECLTEMNLVLGENAVETKVENTIGWMRMLELLRRVRTVIFNSSIERAGKVRMVFNNRFQEFALQFNDFIAQTSLTLREIGAAQDILFIIDGLEKTQTTATRRRIIIEESNRIRRIRANMLFTLPIDLMPDVRNIRQDAEVITFPFIKVLEQNGQPAEAAIERFREFVHRRIAPEMFENETVVREAILLSGGSPRELLRLMLHTYLQSDAGETRLTKASLLRAVASLSADARMLNAQELGILKTVRENNLRNAPTPFLDGMQRLLEQVFIMEYNDGNYKRVNPIIETSSIFREYVG